MARTHLTTTSGWFGRLNNLTKQQSFATLSLCDNVIKIQLYLIDFNKRDDYPSKVLLSVMQSFLTRPLCDKAISVQTRFGAALQTNSTTLIFLIYQRDC